MTIFAENKIVDNAYMLEAIRLSENGMKLNQGGPFGAVIVLDGQIIGKGWNQVILHSDPTAHAEIVAIREACKNKGSFHLHGAVLYSSCEPCPMCLAAIYWAQIGKVYYGNSHRDAADIGFNDSFLYDELIKPIALRSVPMQQIGREEAQKVFEGWRLKSDKTLY